MKTYMAWAFGITLLTTSTFGQLPPPLPPPNTYNLTFELAQPSSPPPPFSAAFLDWSIGAPYWSHSGGADTAIVYYGSPHLGMTPYFLLVSSNSPYYNLNSQLAGKFSLALSSGYQYYNSGTPNNPYGPWVNSYIYQTLPISSSARSIQLLATGPFKVFFGGIEIPMLSLGGNSYGGDITSFAGTTAELKIMNTAPIGDKSETMVDNIVFSATIVPEPSSLALVSLGSLTLFASLRKARRK